MNIGNLLLAALIGWVVGALLTALLVGLIRHRAVTRWVKEEYRYRMDGLLVWRHMRKERKEANRG